MTSTYLAFFFGVLVSFLTQLALNADFSKGFQTSAICCLLSGIGCSAIAIINSRK